MPLLPQLPALQGELGAGLGGQAAGDVAAVLCWLRRAMRARAGGRCLLGPPPQSLLSRPLSTNSHPHPPTHPTQVMDRHLAVLAAKHLETKFVRVAAEKAPFLTGGGVGWVGGRCRLLAGLVGSCGGWPPRGRAPAALLRHPPPHARPFRLRPGRPAAAERLKVWMLPTLAVVKHEKTTDYVVGLDELGGDDFPTGARAWVAGWLSGWAGRGLLACPGCAGGLRIWRCSMAAAEPAIPHTLHCFPAPAQPCRGAGGAAGGGGRHF